MGAKWFFWRVVADGLEGERPTIARMGDCSYPTVASGHGPDVNDATVESEKAGIFGQPHRRKTLVSRGSSSSGHGVAACHCSCFKNFQRLASSTLRPMFCTY